MAFQILSDNQRFKEDESDDSLFYSQARFVHHLDQGFRSTLSNLYKERIPSESIVLDLMSSWVSHLPQEIKYKRVIGHGLNNAELERNHRLNTFWIQDLNRDKKLPLEERFKAQQKLSSLPRNSSRSRIRNGCQITGRPHGVYRKLKISRIALRQLGLEGKIPGMIKSSW